MAKTTTFFTWIKQFKDEDSRFGDLAKDILKDIEWHPEAAAVFKRRGKAPIRRHLEANGACWACMDTFEEAWDEYKAYTNGRR